MPTHRVTGLAIEYSATDGAATRIGAATLDIRTGSAATLSYALDIDSSSFLPRTSSVTISDTLGLSDFSDDIADLMWMPGDTEQVFGLEGSDVHIGALTWGDPADPAETVLFEVRSPANLVTFSFVIAGDPRPEIIDPAGLDLWLSEVDPLLSGPITGGPFAPDTPIDFDTLAGFFLVDGPDPEGPDSGDPTGTGGDDALTGGGGDDTLDGGAGNDSIDGGAGNDVVLGGGGNDTLDGGSGDDTVSGGGGNDKIVVTGANDSIDGGAGSGDIVVFSGDSTDDEESDFLLGVLFDFTLGQFGIRTGEGGDLTGTIANVEDACGTSGNDRMVGDNSANRLQGKDGNDTILGGGGNDVLEGNKDNDRVFGNLGSDTLRGNEGRDRLFGESGRDSLSGGTGNDVLSGGSGADILIGGDGNDKLNGGRHNDSLFGQAGRDRLVGGGGQDTLVNDRDGGVLLGGSGNDRLVGGSDAGGNRARVGEMVLNGGKGNDTILSGGKRDEVLGGAGHDHITIRGNDQVDAGSGSDTIAFEDGSTRTTAAGGSGADSFVFSTAGRFRITDFEAGLDSLSGVNERILNNSTLRDDTLILEFAAPKFGGTGIVLELENVTSLDGIF